MGRYRITSARFIWQLDLILARGVARPAVFRRRSAERVVFRMRPLKGRCFNIILQRAQSLSFRNQMNIITSVKDQSKASAASASADTAEPGSRKCKSKQENPKSSADFLRVSVGRSVISNLVLGQDTLKSNCPTKTRKLSLQLPQRYPFCLASVGQVILYCCARSSALVSVEGVMLCEFLRSTMIHSSWIC